MSARSVSVTVWILVLAIIGETTLLMLSPNFDLALVGLLHVAAFSVIAAITFAWDKWCATRGAARVRESTLLTMSVLGGALGAVLAMLAVRHKTRRPLFWIIVCCSLFVHVTMVGWLFVSR